MDMQGIEKMMTLINTANKVGKALEPKKAKTDGENSLTDFAEVLKNSIDKVNQTQQTADQMQTAFAAGDTTQNLHEVMIALQTASVSFQEMVQVRNKLVTAYQDVMSMQV
ncbi:MAG: flagellar hook-basal body complex protein FliE [Rhodocyclaceae bacterium]